MVLYIRLLLFGICFGLWTRAVAVALGRSGYEGSFRAFILKRVVVTAVLAAVIILL